MTPLTVEATGNSPDAGPSDLLTAMTKISRFCSTQRVEMKDEKVAQEAMETALTGAGYEFKREHRLSGKDIPDFLITESGYSIVLEMKTRAQRMQIYRQLERYSKHQAVDGLILLSGTAMGLPEHINGKPAVFASLGRGWLR